MSVISPKARNSDKVSNFWMKTWNSLSDKKIVEAP